MVNWAKVSEYYEKYASQGKPVVSDLRDFIYLLLSGTHPQTITIVNTHCFEWL